jgi:hypothetical protein
VTILGFRYYYGDISFVAVSIITSMRNLNLVSTKIINSFIGLGVIPMALTSQTAIAASFSFTQSYTSLNPELIGGGTLSGLFSGEDLNNDGKLTCQLNASECEISAFTAIFDGLVESSIPDDGFEREAIKQVWRFPTLESFDFDFDLTTNSLLLGTRTEPLTGLGSSDLFIDPSFGGGMDLSVYGDFFAEGQPMFTTVPEPTTILGSLVGGGLWLQLKHRKKQAKKRISSSK